MYWLLSYAKSIEKGTREWSEALLMNPRRNASVRLEITELVDVLSAGTSKVQLLERFLVVVGERGDLVTRTG